MSHEENKVSWCLKKAEKEIASGKKHRGLIKISPDFSEAKKHLEKAEHNLKAVEYFDTGGFSDWSMSAIFYCIYHCFLAISSKFGYESRNQECTISLIKALKEKGKIELEERFIRTLEAENEEERQESSVIENRENYTYGTSTSTKNTEEIKRNIQLCKDCLNQTRNIIFRD